MANIYQYEFADPRNNWRYYLFVYPASNTALPAEPTYIDLPEGCLDLVGADRGFDGLPIGLEKASVIRIKWYMDALDPDIYGELISAIYEPTQGLSVEPDQTLNAYFPESPVSIKGSTIYRLRLYRATGTLQDVLIGCQTAGIEANYDEESETIEVEIESVGAAAAKQIPLTTLAGQEGSVEQSSYCYEFVRESDNWYIYHKAGHFGSGGYYLFMKFDDFWAALEDIYSKTVSKMLRREVTATLAKPATVYYKQLYDGSGGLGDELASSEIYLLGWRSTSEARESGRYEGFMGNATGESFAAMYKCLWDFIVDLYQEGQKAVIGAEGSIEILAIDEGGDYPRPLSRSNGDFHSLKYQAKANILQFAQSSPVEVKESDADVYEVSAVASYNDKSFNIPIVFNNSPTVCAYENVADASTKKSIADKPHYWNLYYQNGSVFYRVHEFCDAPLGSGMLSDLPDCEFSPVSLSSWDWRRPTEAMAKLQTESTKGLWLAKYILALYSQSGQAAFDCEIPLDLAMLDIYGSSVDSFVLWEFASHCFEIVKSELNTYLNCPQYDNISEVSIDFMENKVKIKTISRVQSGT